MHRGLTRQTIDYAIRAGAPLEVVKQSIRRRRRDSDGRDLAGLPERRLSLEWGWILNT
jgi:hypothetical protein